MRDTDPLQIRFDEFALRRCAVSSRAPARTAQAALVEARAQQALWLELNALVALCELDDAAPENLDALEDARRRLREGLDTALAIRANEMLHTEK